MLAHSGDSSAPPIHTTLRRLHLHLPQVHGLLVGERVTPPMQALCTHLHIFKSWSVVGGRAAAQW